MNDNKLSLTDITDTKYEKIERCFGTKAHMRSVLILKGVNTLIWTNWTQNLGKLGLKSQSIQKFAWLR